MGQLVRLLVAGTIGGTTGGSIGCKDCWGTIGGTIGIGEYY